MIHSIPPMSGAKNILPDHRWAVLPDLITARTAFGLNDRDLTVLRGLISCLPKGDLAKTFVFASNHTLSARCDGMNERTLRRHLARLITAGVITRHDSPNRKRYARRVHIGAANPAFGFDLAPLYAQAQMIRDAALQMTARTDQVAALRQDLSLLRQSLIAVDPVLADSTRKLLRRKTTPDILRNVIAAAKQSLETHELTANAASETLNLSGNDSQTVRHIQISLKESYGSEDCNETRRIIDTQALPDHRPPSENLAQVLLACPESCSYAYQPLTNWPDLIRFADVLAPIVQIDKQVITAARQAMGAVGAAVTVLCIVQMGQHVRSAGAYLRYLTKRAQAGLFSTAPLVQALLGVQAKLGAGG